MGEMWDFLRSVSVHFGSPSQNVLKLILKSHTIRQFPHLGSIRPRPGFEATLTFLDRPDSRDPGPAETFHNLSLRGIRRVGPACRTGQLQEFFISDFSTFLFRRAKMCWNVIWKSPGFVTFVANLTHFRFKSGQFGCYLVPHWSVYQTSVACPSW